MLTHLTKYPLLSGYPLQTHSHIPGADLFHQGGNFGTLTVGHLMSPLKCPQDVQKASGTKFTSARDGPGVPPKELGPPTHT